jgi:serine/threonine-protein kinase HipA
MIEVNVCPGTLKEGYHTYSPRCIREVFGGSVVSHQLNIDLTEEGKDHLLKLHRRSIFLKLLRPI